MVRLIIWRVGLLSCFCSTQKEVLHSLLHAHLSLPHATALTFFLLISVSSWTDYYTVTSTPSPGFLFPPGQTIIPLRLLLLQDFCFLLDRLLYRYVYSFSRISVSSWTDYYTVTSTPSPGFLFPPGQTIIPLRLLLLQDFCFLLDRLLYRYVYSFSKIPPYFCFLLDRLLYRYVYSFSRISVSSWTDYYTVTSTPSPGFLFPPGQTIIPLRLLLLQDFCFLLDRLLYRYVYSFSRISVSSWTDYYTVTSTPSPGFLFPPGQTIIPLRLLLLQDFCFLLDRLLYRYVYSFSRISVSSWTDYYTVTSTPSPGFLFPPGQTIIPLRLLLLQDFCFLLDRLLYRYVYSFSRISVSSWTDYYTVTSTPSPGFLFPPGQTIIPLRLLLLQDFCFLLDRLLYRYVYSFSRISVSSWTDYYTVTSTPSPGFLFPPGQTIIPLRLLLLQDFCFLLDRLLYRYVYSFSRISVSSWTDYYTVTSTPSPGFLFPPGQTIIPLRLLLLQDFCFLLDRLLYRYVYSFSRISVSSWTDYYTVTSTPSPGFLFPPGQTIIPLRLLLL